MPVRILFGGGICTMEEKKKTGLKWFGERKPVRLMLLGALLVLGILHIESLLKALNFLWQVAQPLVTGAVMAYILEVVVKRLERIYFPRSRRPIVVKTRRPLCIALATILVFSLVALIVGMVIPGMGEAFDLLASEVPKYLGQLQAWILENAHQFPAIAESVQDWQLDWTGIGVQIINYAFNGMGGLLSSTVTVIGAVTGTVFNFFMSVIFAFFLLAGKDKLKMQTHRIIRAALPEKRADQLRHVISVTHKAFSGFIVGQALNGLILGAATWLGMSIFNMPYALIVGVLSGVTALIPIIGGYIGAIVGAFLVFTQSPGMAIWFLVYIIILQQIQGNVIYPRLVSSSIGLPGIWVLAAVTIGGGLGGVVGMLVGVPIAAILYILIRETVQKREQLAAAEGENAPPLPPKDPPAAAM